MKRFTFGCRGKISYLTRKLASAAKRAMHAKDRGVTTQLNVFVCRQCGGYHIGRQRRTGYGTGVKPHRKDSERSRKARYIELVEQES